MEQLPSSWTPWYGINNDHMWLYNQYMDIYRFYTSDGSWGDNGVNEFGGWPSDADLYNQYGFHWGGGLAVTIITSYCECCRIIESDIVFNPAYSWTADQNYAEDNPTSVVYYDSILLHEMGHSWGMQNRNETYDYDEPTVMHSYNPNSIQDRMTIHSPEAYLIRRHYDDQTSIRTLTNMGVFSKYAQSTWRNSWTTSSYFAGDSITINNITLENTGTTTLSNVHIRLYLSTNRTISTGDTLIGDWSWESFTAEAYGVYDFTTTIPSSLSVGTYYVGAIITYNGYSYDGFSSDNTTRLWDTIYISDDTPPNPNPMTWATAPYGLNTSQIRMVATAATDVSRTGRTDRC
jgi:hypothetical protein